MTKIAPGGDNISDASQHPAQQMVQAAKGQKKDDSTQAAAQPRMKFAAQKIVHTPETPADYAKRVREDRELKNLKPIDNNKV